MDKKITYKLVEKLIAGIKACGDQSVHPFRNKLLRNNMLFEDELKKQYSTMEEPDGINEYREKESKIITKYAIGFDDNRNPIYGDNQKDAIAELNELRESNKELLEAFSEMRKHFYEVVMNEEIDFVDKIRFIEVKELPNKLTLSQSIGIAELIKYND